MSNILENIDLYDLYNIEYSDLILDIHNEINEYINNPFISFNKTNGDYSKLINIIYRNIDYLNSSEILDNIKKRDIQELEYELNSIEEDFILDNEYN